MSGEGKKKKKNLIIFKPVRKYSNGNWYKFQESADLKS